KWWVVHNEGTIAGWKDASGSGFRNRSSVTVIVQGMFKNTKEPLPDGKLFLHGWEEGVFEAFGISIVHCMGREFTPVFVCAR
ncbi:hypothetical protein, partial [Heyndrickxia coagulans]|nr:hypothetical protein [Heyndrickxia coagulans]MED4537611.1 hypothetical protein [Heyndrickxia coagulans]